MSSNRGMGDIMKQAQRMQQQLARLQDEMADREIEATSGGGAVLAVVNGKQELIRLDIAKEVVDPEDIDTLRDLIIAAVNLAHGNAREMVESEMNKITGGLSIPGLL